jgi:hypothetical protein
VRLVVQPQRDIGEWVAARAGVHWNESMPAIGFVGDEEQMLAAATFNDYTGRSIAVHIAITEPCAFRALIRAIGRYAFEQLGCTRLTLMTEAGNEAVVRLHQRLGAVHEGTLKGASKSGDDILLSRFEPTCEFWRKVNGQRWR